MALFYITPKGSQVPLSNITAITSGGVRLKSGQLIKDERDKPVFKEMYGDSQEEVINATESLAALASEHRKLRDSVKQFECQVNLKVDAAIKQCAEEFQAQINELKLAISSITRETRKMTDTREMYNAVLREFEEEAADQSTS